MGSERCREKAHASPSSLVFWFFVCFFKLRTRKKGEIVELQSLLYNLEITATPGEANSWAQEARNMNVDSQYHRSKVIRYFGLDVNSSSSVALSWPAGASCPSHLYRWENPCPHLPCIHIFTCQPSFLPDSTSWETFCPCQAFVQKNRQPCLQREPARWAFHHISHCLVVIPRC